MILHTGLRTDIPAFLWTILVCYDYTLWQRNRAESSRKRKGYGNI